MLSYKVEHRAECLVRTSAQTAPELLQKVRVEDPMRAKHLGRALEQLAEEGAAQAFKRRIGAEYVVGVVGRLQFDVLADRIGNEYSLPVRFEATPYITARWIDADEHRLIEKFCQAHEINIAEDHLGQPVFLARNDWQIEHAADDFPGIRLRAIKQQASQKAG